MNQQSEGRTECPMRRLLRDCQHNGRIEVDYEQQWKTFFKGQRLGYIDDRGFITAAGRAALSKTGETA